MKNLLLLLLTTIALGFTACDSNQAHTHEEDAIDMVALRAELQGMEDAYATAQNAKDAEAVVMYYADDAVSLSNNRPAAVGKAAILADVKDQMATDTIESTIRFEVVDVFAQGNLAVEVGRSISSDANGKETKGKYISVFEKRDGKWICIRDCYNNDAPPMN